jgi:hypothetical protein
MKAPQIFGKQILLKSVMIGVAVSCLGAAVVAAPLSAMSKNKVPVQARVTVEKAAFAPLGQGPALQLGRAAFGAEEDCVKVTRITGPDGSIYATRGLVCAE